MQPAIDLEPEQAVEDFLAERTNEVSKSSWRNYKYPLKESIEFCDDREIDSMADVNGYELKKFKQRRRESGITEVTVKNHLSTLRMLLRWCEEAQAVEPGLHELVQLLDPESDQYTSDDFLALEHIEGVLDHLYKFEYATMKHATFHLIWHTCIRMGTLQSFDLDDWIPESNQLRVRHRPETETPLKNGDEAERLINISSETTDIVNDYIEGKRTPGTDNHNREPLITSSRGNRLNKTTLRRNIYGVTYPS